MNYNMKDFYVIETIEDTTLIDGAYSDYGTGFVVEKLAGNGMYILRVSYFEEGHFVDEMFIENVF